MLRMALFIAIVLLAAARFGNNEQDISPDRELAGYWKLQGDCLDHSGNNNNGINHGVDLVKARFDGSSSYIEIPDNPSLDFGSGDFTIAAWICTDKIVNDVPGDIIDKYDPAERRGVTLTVSSGSGGCNSQGTDRHVLFGIDNARGADKWEDCGRLSSTCTSVSSSLIVFRGKLYAATGNANDEKDLCHVYRYEGNRKWTDLGRVGDKRSNGVGPMIVHDGELYAGTTAGYLTSSSGEENKHASVYRFKETGSWVDCGNPGEITVLNCIASYRGKLFAGGGPKTPGVFTQYDTTKWIISKIFGNDGPERSFPNSMIVYNNKLYVGNPGIFSFDGKSWVFEGNPLPGKSPEIYPLIVYGGKLCAAMQPGAEVFTCSGNEGWQALGKAGETARQVTAMAVYNGKLYSGSLPNSEVCRFDGSGKWTSLKSVTFPAEDPDSLSEWSGITGLTVYDGKLYAGSGAGTKPSTGKKFDYGGKVFCMEAGKMATFDMDLGPGWRHIVAVRRGGILQLFIDGLLVKTTPSFNPALYELSNDAPLRIGFGPTDFFNGRISEVRMYSRALPGSEIRKLYIESKMEIMNYFSFR
jgi:hypothetical protein